MCAPAVYKSVSSRLICQFIGRICASRTQSVQTGFRLRLEALSSMTSPFSRLISVLFVFCTICHQCSALPVPEDSKHVVRRRATSTGDNSAKNEFLTKSSVASFIESGRMVNDYVWVDVTTTKFVPVPGNDLEFGDCVDDSDDELIYFDNTVIENSGPSTLNGTLEIYIDAPLNITCVRVIDQIRDGTGGVPSFNSLGTNWAKIDVAGQYGKGFHFHIYVYGIRVKRINPDKDKERDQSKDSQSNLV